MCTELLILDRLYKHFYSWLGSRVPAFLLFIPVNHIYYFGNLVCVLQVGPPAQIHLAEQFVIRGFLDEIVDVSLY